MTDGYYKGGLCYGEKNKVALMLVITLLFNIFYTSNVFATNLNINILSVLKINSMITDINSVVNLSANDEVELDIKYTNSNKNILEFEAINVLEATKKLTEEYKSKNTFRYVKDGIEYTTPAFDFHIFSTEAILSAHTNGNIATKDLDAGGQGFGASQSSSLKLNEEHY